MSERETKVGVLDKAIAILYAFSSSETALSPLEIAARTHLPLPTVYRLTQALSAHGLLGKEGQRFRLGMTLMHLGSLVAQRIDLGRQALPHLKWLNEQTGENAELHVRQGDTRIAVEAVRSTQPLRSIVDIGEPLPLHLGAAGKVLLAWLPPQERDELAVASARRFSGEAPFDLAHLGVQLEQVRSRGWIASNSERAPGVAAIAAPIFDVTSCVAGALTLTAASVRLPLPQQEKFAPLVRQAAAQLSQELGYTRDTTPRNLS